MKDKKPWYEKVSIWIGLIAAICSIIISIPQIKTFLPLTQKELNLKIESLKEEISLLDMQVHHIVSKKEYILINGEGTKIDASDVSDMLDYHKLISKMEELSEYYYFLDLITYMHFEGYKVEEEKMSTLTDLFFGLNYDEQVDILSRMFIFYKYLTLDTATGLYYTENVTEYEDHNGYSNVIGEKRSYPIYMCVQNLSDSLPFNLIRITEENKDMVYPKIHN